MPRVPFHLYNLFALSSLHKQSFIIIIIFTAIQYNYWMEFLAENSFNYCRKKVIIDVCLLECCFFLKLSCQRKYNLFFPWIELDRKYNDKIMKVKFNLVMWWWVNFFFKWAWQLTCKGYFIFFYFTKNHPAIFLKVLFKRNCKNKISKNLT